MTWPTPPLGSLVQTIVPARDKPVSLDGPIPWVRIEDFEGKFISGSKSGQGVTQATIAAMPLRVFPPQTVVCTCSCSMGTTAIVTTPLVTNQTFIGLIPRPERLSPDFLYWALQGHRDRLTASAEGAIQSYLSKEDFRTLRLPVPPLSAQRAIADYLDRETARIDALIAAKKRMVELLEDRRRAARDSAFRADSGLKLKHLLRSRMAYGVLVPQFVAPGQGTPMIRTFNLGARGDVRLDDVAEIPDEMAAEYTRTQLQVGDVILSVVGGMGRAAIADFRCSGANLNRPLARLQPVASLPSRLLWHWTQTTQFMDLAVLATGSSTAQPTLNLGDLAEFPVGLPRDSATWERLRADLDSVCAAIDCVDDALADQLKLLAEHRQTLITAAVTGQLDIPGAAA